MFSYQSIYKALGKPNVTPKLHTDSLWARFIVLTLGIALMPGYSTAQPTGFLMKEQIWAKAMKGNIVEQVYLDGNKIFVAAEASPLFCIDKNTGTVQWQTKEDLPVRGFVHAITGDRNWLYINGMSKNLLALRKDDGRVSWMHSCRFDDDLFSTIRHDEKYVYVNPLAPEFLIMEKSGTIYKKIPLPDICMSFCLHDEQVIAQLSDGTYILDLKKASVKKVISIAGAGNRSVFAPSVFDEKFLIHYRDTLRCYHRQTYKVLWTLASVSGYHLDGGKLMVYDAGSFSRIDPENGESIWKRSGNFNWYLQPVVYKNAVYIQTRYQFLILDLQKGETLYASDFPYKSYTRPLVEDDRIYAAAGPLFVCLKNPLALKQ